MNVNVGLGVCGLPASLNYIFGVLMFCSKYVLVSSIQIFISNIVCTIYAGSCGTVYHAQWYGSV